MDSGDACAEQRDTCHVRADGPHALTARAVRPVRHLSAASSPLSLPTLELRERNPILLRRLVIRDAISAGVIARAPIFFRQREWDQTVALRGGSRGLPAEDEGARDHRLVEDEAPIP